MSNRIAKMLAAGVLGRSLDPNLRLWRSAVRDVRAGVRHARLAFIGDSTQMGVGAGSGGASNLTGAYAVNYPTVLTGLLNTQLVKTVNNSFVGDQKASDFISYPLYDPRCALGTGFSFNVASLGGRMLKFTAGSVGTFSFTPESVFDTIVVYYLRNSTYGSFTVNVDGGTSLGTISETGSAAYLSAMYTVDRGTHTVNLVATNNNQFHVGGIYTYDSTAPAINILQCGESGASSTTVSAAANPWSALNVIGALAPDLSIINLTVNDSNNGTGTAAYQTNMQAIISKAKLSGDVLLMVGAPSNTTQATDGTLDSYIAVLRSLAQANGCSIVSLKDRWGSYAAIQSTFPYYDDKHPGALAHADTAQALWSALKRV